jgi:hypothetical protein
MRTHPLASIFPAVLVTLVACTEPQTPASDGAGTTAATTAPTATAAPTLTAVPTGAASITDTPSAPSTATATASAPVEKVTAPYVLVFHQTGGIAGMHMETIIDTAAKRITYGGLRNQRPETRELAADDIATITRALEAARLTTFPGKIKGGPVADAFTYTITVKTGGKEYMVSWDDGTNVPEPYSNLRSAVNAVRASRFGGEPPRGAATM